MNFIYLKLYLSLLASAFSYMNAGMIVSYPSPAFPDINSGDYGFKLSDEAMSWLSSFSGLFAIPGALLAIPLMDRYGRKFAIITTVIPQAAGWLLVLSSFNVVTLGVGRAITGIAMGMIMASIIVYIAEISPKHMRGKLNLFAQLFFAIAVVLSHSLGVIMNWRWIAVVSLIITFTIAISSLFMYETPRWLISKGHYEIAADVMKSIWNLNDAQLIREEIDAIENNIKLVSSVNFFQGLYQLFKPPLWKPLLITQMLMAFQQFTGLGYINTYTVQIYEEALVNMTLEKAVMNNPSYESALSSLSAILGSLAALFVIDRFGRRFLLISSGIMIAISLSLIATYFYAKHFYPSAANDYLYWMPFIGIFVYVFNINAAYAGIPFLLLGELFPLHVRSTANSLGQVTRNLCTFIVSKCFSTTISIPNYDIFWVFASLALASVVFVIFFVPETKGRSLEEIQKQWYKKKIHEIRDSLKSGQVHPA